MTEIFNSFISDCVQDLKSFHFSEWRWPCSSVYFQDLSIVYVKWVYLTVVVAPKNLARENRQIFRSNCVGKWSILPW